MNEEKRSFEANGLSKFPTHMRRAKGLLVTVVVSGLITSASLAGGRIDGWGDNAWGQLEIPVSTEIEYQAVAAGDYHSLALRDDGRVVGWGGEGSDYEGVADAPAGLTDVVAIDAGTAVSMALKADGTVVTWGPMMSPSVSAPEGLGEVVGIAAGGFHALAVRCDGSVVAWGQNDSGQAEVPDDLSDVIQVAGGSWHSLALKRDGSVVAWGSNGYGQTDVPPGLSDVVAISAGERHSLALRADGTVVSWGGAAEDLLTPPIDLEGVLRISAGSSYCTALKHDGTLVVWGRDLRTGGPIADPNLPGSFVAIAAGGQHALVLSGSIRQDHLVSDSAVWRYHAEGIDLGTAWVTPDYEDTAWPGGPAQLGYGDGDEQTLIPFGPDSQQRFITSYFRHTFEVEEVPPSFTVRLYLLVDDGAIVYLNGTEVVRRNLPAGDVSAQTTAVQAVGGTDEGTFFGYLVHPQLLQPGRNTLAVEVHQVHAASSDLSFALGLTGYGVPAPAGPVMEHGRLKREVYADVRGPELEALLEHPSFPDSPAEVNWVDSFEAPSNVGDNYGQRLSGFLLPPVTGEYVFYLCSDDQSRLYLSTDEAPANRVLIAEELSWSPPRLWAGGPRPYDGNVSAPILLVGGRSYYVEALMAEGGGGDHLAVAWQRPGDPVPENGSAPIGGEYLMKWDGELPDPPDPELHVVGLYSGTAPDGGTSHDHEQGICKVVVDRPDRRVTLLLSAYEPVEWRIVPNDGTHIEKVILCGYYEQTVSGVNAEVIRAYRGGDLPDPLYIGHEIESATFYRALPRITLLTQMEISSFHGGYQAPYPVPVRIDEVQDDPRLKPDYPTPLPPDHLPDLSFQLAFFQPGGSTSGDPLVRVNFTELGPVDGGSVLPGIRMTHEAEGRYYYGAESHQVWEVDDQTGQAAELRVDPALPELSWPMGMTVDTKRDRALLVSLGGQGYLYAYGPGTGQWSVLASMENLDLDCIAYHGVSDALFGVTVLHPEGGRPRLVRFDPDGAYQGEMELPFLPSGTGPGGYRTELASVGEYLVLLWGAGVVGDPMSEGQSARMYIIHPERGDVLLAWSVRDPIPQLEIEWPTPGPIVYGEPLGGLQLNASANVPGTFEYHPPAGTLLDAGTHTLTAVFHPLGSSTGLTHTADVTLEVLRAPLTIGADDKTRLQGEPNPPFTAHYLGFVAGDDAGVLDQPVTLSTVADGQSPPGQYVIRAAGASDANYAITHVNGTLTVLAPAIHPGAVDFTFVADLPGHSVRDMVMDSAGRLLVGGTFRSVNGIPRDRLARLLPGGDPDPDYPDTAFLHAPVRGLVCSSAESVFVACDVIALPYRTSYGIVKLDEDGQVDPVWVSPFAEGSRVTALAPMEHGTVLVGGQVQTSGDSMRFRVVHLLWHGEPDGKVDASLDGTPRALAVQPDGKILVAGGFSTVNGQARGGLARLLANGELDPDFEVHSDLVADLHCVAIQPDGRILVGGEIIISPLPPWHGVLRFHPNGRVDESFVAEFLPHQRISSVALQSDGRILVGGDFEEIQGRPYAGIARLHPNGQLDQSFNPGEGIRGVDAEVVAMAIQPDGKVVIGGAFESVDGVPRHGLARLHGNVPMAGWVDRQLPPSYVAGQPFTVQLHAQPPGSVSAFAVEDTPPEGWMVGQMSHEGMFDPVQGKVKFGPFFDSEPRRFTYRLTPSTGAEGEQHFSGIASADGDVFDVTGDHVMVSAAPLHPADYPAEDLRLTIGEITAYGSAWRNGILWPVSPNPIPMDYVTRAGALWRLGEFYLFEPQAGAPPFCWISPLSQPHGLGDGTLNRGLSPMGAAVGAEFIVPEAFEPGALLHVGILARPPEETASYAIEAECPLGCEVVALDDGGVWDSSARMVRFGPYLDGAHRLLGFTVRVDKDCPEALTFFGLMSFDGNHIVIEGMPRSYRTIRLRASRGGDGCQLVLNAEVAPGALCVIEASTDLRDWQAVHAPMALGQEGATLDPQSLGEGYRFYRVRLLVE